VADSETLNAGFCCGRFDMGTARCKRSGPSFYLRKHTFDCVSIPVFNHLESTAIVTEGITQRLRIINEELD